MRVSIERLAWMISDEPGDATLGELADKYETHVDRIMDAMDVLKIRRGEPTTLPPIEWDDGVTHLYRVEETDEEAW